MKNTWAVTALVTLFAVSESFHVWGADGAFPALQEAAAAAAGYKKTDIEVKSTAHQVTIIVVNSKLNNGVTAERTTEALKIASAGAKFIAGKPEFAAVVIIHVDYVKRAGNDSAVIEGIDFNKAPDGSFKLHLT
jgi:hypothetical protein